MPLHIFTSAACNYWPKVAVLFESIRRYHPHAQIHWALADEWPTDHPLPAGITSILPVSKLPLPNPRAWAFGHSLVELATAIKPFLLEQLLERGDGPVLYLDPDIQLHAPLDTLLAKLDNQYSIILTPHLTHPESEPQAILDNEGAALKHGTYNLGFIAVASDLTGRAFARWWRDRCTRWCIEDIPNGFFTDQRWCDLVPALFPRVAIERTPGYNVAPWNLNQRCIELNPMDGFIVTASDGTVSPLYFYHYTGWDKGAHHTMVARYGKASPPLFKLLAEYEAACRRYADTEITAQPWFYGTYDDGEPIPLAARRIYRARPDLQARYPNPFSVDPADNYRHWYLTQGSQEYPDLDRSLQPVPAINCGRWRKLYAMLRHPTLFAQWLAQQLRWP